MKCKYCGQDSKDSIPCNSQKQSKQCKELNKILQYVWDNHSHYGHCTYWINYPNGICNCKNYKL